MKKVLVLITSLTLFGTSISLPAYGAVKAGATCAKVGVNSIVSGKKFTCVKTGKKLVWDNGAVMVKPAVQQTGTEQSAEATSPTGIPGNLVITETDQSITFSWTAPQAPKIQPEFYRIEGNCTLDNAACGTFRYDLWSNPDSGVLATNYSLQKSNLSNSANGAQWDFSISARNQTKRVDGPSANFGAISLGQNKTLGTPFIPTDLTIKEMDSCPLLGKRVNGANSLLECRRIVGNKLVWISIHKDLPVEIKNISSPKPTSYCQLTDHRTSKTVDWPGIAFPATAAPGFQTKGNFKIVVVGIDFPDAVGAGKPSDVWKSDITKAKEWMDWYSSGQVKYDFVSTDKWLHESLTSDHFETASESEVQANQKEVGGLTPNEMATSYLNLIGKAVDIKGATAVWVYFPKNITGITHQWTSQLAGPVNTQDYGTINTDIIAVAKETYDGKTDIWRWFLHEMIHRHGVFGHSPKVPVLTGVMSTFNSWTQALLPWDALVVDWQSPGDYYCTDKNEITSPVEITLVPLEREQRGYKAITIKLSDSQLLIIDSHRRDKWSSETMPGQYGVMMTLVDTSKNSSFDVGEDGSAPSTSEFIKMQNTDHGHHRYFPYGIADKGVVDNGAGIANDLDISGEIWSIDLNYLMYFGESQTFQGITVSLTKTGDNDTVKIEKAA